MTHRLSSMTYTQFHSHPAPVSCVLFHFMRLPLGLSCPHHWRLASLHLLENSAHLHPPCRVLVGSTCRCLVSLSLLLGLELVCRFSSDLFSAFLVSFHCFGDPRPAHLGVVCCSTKSCSLKPAFFTLLCVPVMYTLLILSSFRRVSCGTGSTGVGEEREKGRRAGLKLTLAGTADPLFARSGCAACHSFFDEVAIPSLILVHSRDGEGAHYPPSSVPMMNHCFRSLENLFFAIFAFTGPYLLIHGNHWYFALCPLLLSKTIRPSRPMLKRETVSQTISSSKRQLGFQDAKLFHFPQPAHS